MNKFIVLLLLCSAQLGFSQTAEQQLQSLMDGYWNYRLQENPTLATGAGISDFNHLLPQVSPVDQARRLRSEEEFLAQLRQVDRDELNRDDQINFDLLGWVLERSIDGLRLNTSRIPFNTFSGFFTGALRASSHRFHCDARAVASDASSRAAFDSSFGTSIHSVWFVSLVGKKRMQR